VSYPAPDSVLVAHRNLAPEHLECTAQIAQRQRLKPLADRGATAVEAMEELWPDLTELVG
jgi:hypothetical protein